MERIKELGASRGKILSETKTEPNKMEEVDKENEEEEIYTDMLCLYGMVS